MASCSTSTSLRLFSPTPHLKKPPNPSKPHLLFRSSPISFQRLTTTTPPPKSTTSPSPSAAVDPAHFPAPLRDIVALFQSVPDPKARYKQLLAYAAKLPPMDPAHKTEANRVHGCVSQVWVHAARDEPDRVRFQADSDAQLTKGLAALLVLGLSGAPASEVARVPSDFIELLGIKQSLSPSRNSGLLNMLNLMKRKALEIAGAGADDAALQEEIKSDGVVENLAVNGYSTEEKKEFQTTASSYAASVAEENSDAEGNDQPELKVASSMRVNGGFSGGRKERIRERLEKELSPVELEIEDISHLHKGHAGAAGSNGETHFNVRVVSEEFEGKSLLKRHRLVYDLLQEELKSGLHALSIDAKTPSEV